MYTVFQDSGRIQLPSLEKRLYFLVLYNISPIQQGIQALHAAIEYDSLYGKDEDYLDWKHNWKTVILLNGGTSNEGSRCLQGSMEQHHKALLDNDVKAAHFHEPDLNHALTAVSFLVDERVFNKEKYPAITIADFDEFKHDSDTILSIKRELKFSSSEGDSYNRWVKDLGRENVFLRNFLKQFRLA